MLTLCWWHWISAVWMFHHQQNLYAAWTLHQLLGVNGAAKRVAFAWQSRVPEVAFGLSDAWLAIP